MTGTSNSVNGPEAAPYLAKSGGTMSGAINMGANLITNLLDPVSAQDAATRNYVDLIATGGGQPVVAASTAPFTVTYSNGTGGVGATLTNAGAQVVFSLDGQSPTVGQRVLIKDQASTLQNGVYIVTNVGSGATNWILTRASDYDTVDNINDTGIIPVTSGTLNQNTGWYNTTKMVTVGATAITYVIFGVNPTTIVRTVKVQTFSALGSQTYTPSTGMIACTVEIVGAGGGSGGSLGGAGQSSCTGGGGGGGYCRKTYTSTLLGATGTVFIGTKGAAGSSGSNPGGDGTASTFTPAGAGVVLTANGGKGSAGSGSATATINTGTGNDGGTATNGDLNITGSAGGVGIVLLGSTGHGFGGNGGSSYLSNITTNPFEPAASLTGLKYGAGASGEINATGANAAGAAGDDGFCIITEYCSQ